MIIDERLWFGFVFVFEFEMGDLAGKLCIKARGGQQKKVWYLTS